jgi:hypothetical protein
VSGPTEVPNNKCLIWRLDGGNCQIQACNQRPDGASSYMSAFAGRTSYGLVKEWCAPQKAGGRSPGDAELMTYAVNNPDSRSSPTSRVKRSAQGRSLQGGLTVEIVSLAEAEAIREQAKQVNQPASIQKREVSQQTLFVIIMSWLTHCFVGHLGAHCPISRHHAGRT